MTPDTPLTDKLIDGKAAAALLRARVAEAATAFTAAEDRKPGLAVVLVGEDPASAVYVRSKHKATIEAGMESFEYRRPATIGEDELLELVEELNGDPRVDGILVQLPLPPHIDEDTVIATIDPDKDVDGFHIANAGRLAVGQQGFVPCTPLGCLMLLRATLGDLKGLEAVIVGRSNIVGKPMAQLLLAEHCTVTIAHSRTKDLATVVRRADIVVAAVGRAEMIKGEWIKPGAVVIDVGINRLPPEEEGGKGRLVGDVDTAGALPHVRAITPVPGGVGPMTIAVLLRNTLVAAHARAGKAPPGGFVSAALALLLAGASATTAVDAERAFDAMAAEKGQWTAFRAFAAPDAVMFDPRPVNAHVFLKDRADPPKPVRWQPAESYISCDGTVAVNTGPWQRPDGSIGYFTTVWRRQSDGGWKWLLDHGDVLKKPMPAPRRPKQTRADCTRAKPGVIVRANPPEGVTTGTSASLDGSLRWFWTVAPDGARTFSVKLWTGRAWSEPLVNKVAAD